MTTAPWVPPPPPGTCPTCRYPLIDGKCINIFCEDHG